MPEARATGRGTAHERLQSGVRELGSQELEESVQLVGIATERRRQLGGILALGRLERADVELESVPVLVNPSQDPHGIALAEPGIEQLDVVPDPRLDLPARVDELQREVVGARLLPPPFLPSDRIRALDDAVLGEVRDRAHRSSLWSTEDVTSGSIWPW